jgi:hypothetical protein
MSDQKKPREAADLFEKVMKASVSGNPKPKRKRAAKKSKKN